MLGTVVLPQLRDHRHIYIVFVVSNLMELIVLVWRASVTGVVAAHTGCTAPGALYIVHPVILHLAM